MLLATQEAVEHFNPAGGSIINISSAATSITPPATAVYTATKGAVDAITNAGEGLGPRKIRVNAINPEMVETEGIVAGGFDKANSGNKSRRKLRWAVSARRTTSRRRRSSSPHPILFRITGETLRIAGGLR